MRRVSPLNQAVPDEYAASRIGEPVNVDSSGLMLKLVASWLDANRDAHPQEAGLPSPAQIGGAREQVITKDLPKLVTWWDDFLAAAQTPNSNEAIELRSVREESGSICASTTGQGEVRVPVLGPRTAERRAA